MVGLYFLYNLTETNKFFKKSHIGLYRDDGLAIVPAGTTRASTRTADVLRKKVVESFNKLGLKITTEINITSTDFLDVILDLESGLHKPYRKPNDTPCFIDKRSNHPKVIFKRLPEMIANRPSRNSSNEVIFTEAVGPYNDALARSGLKKS